MRLCLLTLDNEHACCSQSVPSMTVVIERVHILLIITFHDETYTIVAGLFEIPLLGKIVRIVRLEFAVCNALKPSPTNIFTIYVSIFRRTAYKLPNIFISLLTVSVHI